MNTFDIYILCRPGETRLLPWVRCEEFNHCAKCHRWRELEGKKKTQALSDAETQEYTTIEQHRALMKHQREAFQAKCNSLGFDEVHTSCAWSCV